jgi:hypothetical protein
MGLPMMYRSRCPDIHTNERIHVFMRPSPEKRAGTRHSRRGAAVVVLVVFLVAFTAVTVRAELVWAVAAATALLRW